MPYRFTRSSVSTPPKYVGQKTPPGNSAKIVEYPTDVVVYPAGGYVLANPADTGLSYVCSVEQLHGFDLKGDPLLPVGAELQASVTKGVVTLKFLTGGVAVSNGWLSTAGRKIVLRLVGT